MQRAQGGLGADPGFLEQIRSPEDRSGSSEGRSGVRSGPGSSFPVWDGEDRAQHECTRAQEGLTSLSGPSLRMHSMVLEGSNRAKSTISAQSGSISRDP